MWASNLLVSAVSSPLPGKNLIISLIGTTPVNSTIGYIVITILESGSHPQGRVAPSAG